MPRDATAPPTHQRARGRAELSLLAAPGGARLGSLYHAAPLRWLFPEVDPGDPKLGALVNVAGGLAGGDRIETRLTLQPGARFTATTPAAEKIYRSLGDETAIGCAIQVEAEAICEWLPQETILFDGACLSRRFDVVLAPGARCLAAEMLVFGRAAHGERFRRGRVMDRWRIWQDGHLAWADTLRLTNPAEALDARFVMDGIGALATLLLAGPGAATQRERARALSDGGASLVAPEILVARWAGEAGAVRQAVGAAVAALREAAFDHPPRLPRLWRT